MSVGERILNWWIYAQDACRVEVPLGPWVKAGGACDQAVSDYLWNGAGPGAIPESVVCIGTPVRESMPGVARARAFIEQWNEEQQWLRLAESLTDDDVKRAARQVTVWAQA